MKFTNAQDVISYLYSLPNLHAKNDLSYIKTVLKELGNPQNKVKTIHITGTNGKGSTSYYLSNLLKKAGQRTGLFVSPYIYEFNERIQLNNKNISDKDLVQIANLVEEAIEKIKEKDPEFSLVTFEYEVAMAFVYFALKNCDYAVIEVGIGAEHDKTNVIVPEVSVITTIGLDHEKIIGPTIEDIAQEKSGIIKQDRPVVLGNVPTQVLPIVEAKAHKLHSPIYLLGKDFTVESGSKIKCQINKNIYVFDLRPKVESYDIAVSLQAFLLLHLDLSIEKIQEAIDSTRLPGRYHLLSRAPMVILDGAHNIQAMQNLLEFVHAQKKKLNGKLRVLITMMKDKDIDEVFSLFDQDDEIVLTTIPYPRAAKLADFPKNIRSTYPYQVNWQDAFDELQNKSQNNDILLVTGSFYLVGAVLEMEGIDASPRN